jgi:two-component system KDP operon response regulator KdpE
VAALNDIQTILVIDDDEFLLSAIKKKLELSGFKVTASNNVHDAYFKLNIVKPDLILLDVIMPDINGIELMSLINTHFLLSPVPIILMSYLPEKELTDMGYSIGNAHYLAKPFNVNNLPARLQRLLLKV